MNGIGALRKKIKLIENRDLEQNLQDQIPELQGSTSIN